MATDLETFVERQKVGEEYDVSESTLYRLWNKARKQSDAQILRHFILVTSDGKQHNGSDVTKDLVKSLKYEKKLDPKWHVRRSWLEKTYGRVSKPDAVGKEGSEQSESTDDESVSTESKDTQVVAQVIEVLRDQLQVKDKQIEQLNDRLKESHILEINLQNRIGMLPAEIKQQIGLGGESDKSILNSNEAATVVFKEDVVERTTVRPEAGGERTETSAPQRARKRKSIIKKSSTTKKQDDAMEEMSEETDDARPPFWMRIRSRLKSR